MNAHPISDLRGRLAALLEATKVVASSLNLEQSLQAIVQQATIISGTSIVRLVLLDEEARVLRYQVGVGIPPEAERDIVIPLGESFSGQVAATGKPLAVADCREDPRLRFSEHISKYSLISYLGLPVKVGGRILGVLVFNTQSPRTYSDEEIGYLSAFADQAAIAIENARLHEASERRRRHLEALLGATRAITGGLDLRSTLDRIAATVLDVFRVLRANVYRLDPASGTLTCVAVAGKGSPEKWLGKTLPPGSGIAGRVVREGHPVWMSDVFAAPELALPDWALAHIREEGFGALIGVPLIISGDIRGVLVLGDAVGRTFSQEEIQLLMAFADQAAIAVENARLFQEEQERQQQIQAVRAVGEEIARELDLTTLLKLISQRSIELVGATAGSIYLWDEAGEVLTPRAWHGLGEWMREVCLKPGEAVAGTVAQRRKGMIVNDFPASPYAFPLFQERARTTAVLAEPLLYRDRLVGVITLTHTQAGRQFAEEHQYLLRLFADQAAIAIENARLFEATGQAAREARSLYEIAHSLTTSLDPREVLQLISVKTMELLGTPHAQVVLWDEERKTLALGAACGTEAEKVKQQVFRLGEGVNGIVAETRKPLLVNDYQRFFKRRPEMTDLVAVIGVPLLYRDRLLGVLTSHATRPGIAFTQDNLALLASFANQAAIAIENARLYDEVLRHAAELESRVRARTAELEEALRVKTEFLGKMSHELRTPLNFILGFSDLLRQEVAGPVSPKQATYLDRIQGGGRRLLSLVTDVLDIAQVDVGRSRLQLEPVILGPLVQEVLGLVQVQASQKQLHITTSLDPWLPFIVADRFKLGQILHRLLSNGVKFTPAGGRIAIIARRVDRSIGQVVDSSEPVDQLTARPIDSASDYLELAVEDTGIGIRPEDLETIFAAFHQVDGSDTRAYEGAGLGLTLVRRFVEQHGGRVWAESPGLGQGARFVVRLPRLEIPRPKTVLFFEDDEMMRASLTSALEGAGFKVVQAADGAQALAALAGDPPDLLILNLVPPDMDGREILRRVRGVEKIPRFPVLVITGLEGASAEKAWRLGADEFLTKPVSPRVFVDTVLRLLSKPAVGRG